MNDILERALWTFVQGFLSVFTVGQIGDLADLKSVFVAGVVAGGAAVLSAVKTIIKNRVEQL